MFIFQLTIHTFILVKIYLSFSGHNLIAIMFNRDGFFDILIKISDAIRLSDGVIFINYHIIQVKIHKICHR